MALKKKIIKEEVWEGVGNSLKEHKEEMKKYGLKKKNLNHIKLGKNIMRGLIHLDQKY